MQELNKNQFNAVNFNSNTPYYSEHIEGQYH